MHERLAETLHVSDLASVACLSESHFYAEFREAFGQPPMDYVRSLRVAAAARMLAGTTETIAVIAEATGFANPYHLSRVFKQQTGQTPTEYRRANELLFR
jgi:transcriptional regulator GlxA family with amidase domain